MESSSDGGRWTRLASFSNKDGSCAFVSRSAVRYLRVKSRSVKPRYTHDFIEREDRLTLSFYKEEYRDALKFCGSKSERDVDKVKETGLTPVVLESGAISFGEARLTLDCRKLFKSPMSAANFIDKSILEKWYGPQPSGSFHDVYVVEIEGVYEG